MAQTPNAVGSSGSNETRAIKSEIEKTRVEMSETLGEIQDRLRPDHLLQQAKDGVKEAAAGKARSIMNSAGERAADVAYRAKGVGENLSAYAQQHPIRIAVTIGALAWWMLRSRDRSSEWYGAADTSSWDDDGGMSYDDGMSYADGRSLRSRVGEYAATAKGVVGEYASSARETVGEYASTAAQAAGEYAATAREAAGEYAVAARDRAIRASESARRAAGTAATTTNDWVEENPLAAGAIALAVGAAIGMAIPSTEAENRAMGEARDRAWERAAKAAAEIKDNVTKKVETAAETFVGENIIPALRSSSEPMGQA